MRPLCTPCTRAMLARRAWFVMTRCVSGTIVHHPVVHAYRTIIAYRARVAAPLTVFGQERFSDTACRCHNVGNAWYGRHV